MTVSIDGAGVVTSNSFVLAATGGGTITLVPTSTTGNYTLLLPASSGSLGGITNVTVATANGFAGTSSGGTLPSLTLSTSVTGIIKGNGTSLQAAVAGVDYLTSVPNLTGPITSVGTATTIVGPIPAVSLSGTISGAGNTIDNVVIGASTPLTGSFTQANVSTKLLVGGPTSSAYTYGSQLYGAAGQGSSAFQWRYSVDAGSPSILFVKSRGTTPTDMTAVANGDAIGVVNFGGTDGTAVAVRAAINGYVDAAVNTGTSPTTIPTALSFTTGTTVGTTRMTIGSNGIVNMYNAVKVLGNSSPPTGGTTGLGLEITNATNLGIYVGVGAPTLSAAKGSFYMRTDGTTTNNRMYINTDAGTTWTAVITVA
jgi:hypothetical protein